MAKNPIEKNPSRVKQLIGIYKMTFKADRKSILWVSLAAGVPLILGVVATLTLTNGDPVGIILWSVTTVLFSFLLGLIVMSRRAEKAAYAQIEGQPGAVGAVLRSALRRGWTGNEQPIAVNRSMDAVYRAVGPGGVALIGEGSKSRVAQMIADERKTVQRIAPGVEIITIMVTGGEDGVPITKLASTLQKSKRTLNRNEIRAVRNRLSSLGKSLPIPKGIDPRRMRAPRR